MIRQTVQHVYNRYLSASSRKSGSRLIPVARISLLAVLIIGLSACSSDSSSDLRTYVKQIKSKQKGRIPPLPQPEEFEVFAYQQANLRDPFTPLEVIEAEMAEDDNGPRPDMSREKDLLEQYKLGSLKMMGSLERDGQRWALIRTADGTLHRTTIGRHMGQNNGEIISIDETQLELREIMPDGLGKWVEKYTTLTTNE